MAGSARKAGLNWVTLHLFRKTVATVLDDAGKTKEASRQLGYASDEVTKAYSHRQAEACARRYRRTGHARSTTKTDKLNPRAHTGWGVDLISPDGTGAAGVRVTGKRRCTTSRTPGAARTLLPNPCASRDTE